MKPEISKETSRNPKKFVKVTAGPKDWRGSLYSAVFMHHVLVNDYDHYDNVQKRQFWHLRNSSLRIFDAVSSWSVQSVSSRACHHRSCCTTSQTSPKSVEMLCGCVSLDQEPKMLNQNIYALWTCINNYQNKYPRTFLYSTYSYTFIYIICLYFAYFCILQYSSAYYTRFIMSL